MIPKQQKQLFTQRQKIKFKFKILNSNLIYKQGLHKMNRPKSTSRKSSTHHSTFRNPVPTKKQLSDTIYLMQNENQILKLKNQQITYKLDSLNSELRQRTQRVADAEKECQALRQLINGSVFVRDVELESQRKVLLDQIMLAEQNLKIYEGKIIDARKETVAEEERIPILMADRVKYEQELRIAKMQNEGSKKILINLQQQNEQLRQRNNALSLKKYSKQPQQKAISQQIQQRIRLIKNMNLTQKVFKKQATAKLICNLLQNVFITRKKICFLAVEKHGLKKALLKKKMFLLAHIRRNYLSAVKSRVMAKFRQPLKPLLEQEKCLRILQEIRKRRLKARMWRIWRNETAKAEYSLIRRYQSQNTIEKICQTITKSLMISAFNQLKYFNNSHRKQIAVSSIYLTISHNLTQLTLSAFSQFRQQIRNYNIEHQIQNSATSQSQLLVMSRMFYGWVALMKQKKKESLALKFKYFKRFKKIFVIKKRNILSEMLGESKIRINDINLKSVCFMALKQELYAIKEQRVIQEHQKVTMTLKELKEDTNQREIFDKQLDKQTALHMVDKYLKRKAKQALQLWRKQHQRIYCVQKIWSLVSFNLQKTINYAFSRIQIRRFQKLKLSIQDKIASCDYSYNYLVKQNTHIKQVLDKKSHELEKAKFVAILQRLIRREKQIKHQYFYKFLRNGHKCWRVKKTLQNIDQMMSRKLKVIFFFLLQINKKEKIHEQKVQYWTQRHDQKEVLNLMKNSFAGFKQTLQRNKRMRRALTGVFDRNLQLNFYQAFGKMRNESYLYELQQLQEVQGEIHHNIETTNENIQSTSDRIQMLTERLKNKELTFRQRKTMSLYKFFLKNVKNSVGSYIRRWKNKIDEEKKILRFTQILDTKTQSIIKTKFLMALSKTKSQLEKKSLQDKLLRAKNELQTAETNFQRFENESTGRIEHMQLENTENDEITQEFSKRTEHMNNVKLQSALKHRQKYILKIALQTWKHQKDQFIHTWSRLDHLFSTHSIRDAFQTLSHQTKTQLHRDRIKLNLTTIYHKNYKHNVGLMFTVWRNVNIFTKLKENETALKQAMKGMEHVERHYEMVRTKYTDGVNDRIGLWKMRRFTNQWRIYTEKKLKNNQKKKCLEDWLRVGYGAQAVRLLNKHKIKSQAKKNKIINFQNHLTQNKALAFLKTLFSICQKKHSIARLFINKFCFYQQHQLFQQFFTRVKNYHRQKSTTQKDRRAFCIQKVITTFEKKRKDILCQNMRMWKRNMYLMNIEKNLMRRLMRRAMNERVKDLFYAWKLETEARFMVREHISQGEVKKRQVEIKRLKKYLDEYKKQKGLLLQNEQGNFVVSPRFQENKEKQLKRENLLKYKFISRVILSMNGYQAPVKSWNNLEMLTKLRQKCQKCALVVKNRMQKGDLYTSFKIWHNGVVELRKMFDSMQRKDLIRMLNKQKDKMEMDYSKKVEVQEKVQRQLRRYKVLSYQDKRKQRICAQILFRQARKVKSFAFGTWRKRIQQIKDNQAYQLEQRGNNKIMTMQQQVQDLERYQRQLEQHNYMLKQAVQEALELADMIKRITEERDKLRRELAESDISCENLQEENEELNNKLILAQKEAMNLLTLSGKAF